MGFKTMIHHQHSNPPIRYMNGSRAKEVICESKWRSFNRRKDHSVPFFLFLRVCICSPLLFSFTRGLSSTWSLLPWGVSGVLAVLRAVVNVKCRIGEREWEQKESERDCTVSVCGYAGWSSQCRGHIEKVAELFLSASRLPITIILQMQTCFMIVWISLRCKTHLAYVVRFLSL